MLQHIRQSRVLLALLLGLALPHAWPGGLTLCVEADGSRRVEFGCNCRSMADSCACSLCPDDGADGVSTGDSCGCSDFTIALAGTSLPELDSPAAVETTQPLPAELEVQRKVADWQPELAQPPPDLRAHRATVLLI